MTLKILCRPNLNGHVVQIEEKTDCQTALHFDKWATIVVHLLPGKGIPKTKYTLKKCKLQRKHKNTNRKVQTVKRT